MIEANELYIGPQVPPDMAKALGLECAGGEPTAGERQQELSHAAGFDESGAVAEAEMSAGNAAALEAPDAARASRRRGLEASEVRTWERDAKFQRLQEQARRHMQRALLGDSSAGDAGDDDTSPPAEQLPSAAPGTWDASAFSVYSTQLSSNPTLPV